MTQWQHQRAQTVIRMTVKYDPTNKTAWERETDVDSIRGGEQSDAKVLTAPCGFFPQLQH